MKSSEIITSTNSIIREFHLLSTYPKVAVQWLNQALCICQSLCLVDIELLRNRLFLSAKTLCDILENPTTKENYGNTKSDN
jgi:hypothetical protein